MMYTKRFIVLSDHALSNSYCIRRIPQQFLSLYLFTCSSGRHSKKVSSLRSGHGAEVARLADEGRGRPGVGRGGEGQGRAQNAHQGEGEEEAAKRSTRFVFDFVALTRL